MSPYEDKLARAMEAEAATVDVRPDALDEIRRRIAARRTRWFPRGGVIMAFSSGAAALATVVTVFAGMGSCAPRRPVDQNPPITQPSASAPVDATTSAPDPSIPATPATGAPPPQPGVTAPVYVYYVGVDRGQQRLYREVHTVPVGSGSVVAKTRAAVAEMLDGKPYDPDYASVWPASVSVRDVRIEGSTVVVDLAGASVGPSTNARTAVSQLVWTATANSDKDTARILLDGRSVSTLWNSAPIGSALSRGKAAEVLGLTWIIDPQHGSVVGRTFQVHVAGIVFEATMYIRVKRGGDVVDDRFVTLNRGAPEQGEATFSLTLPPGTYTIETFEVSPADGSEQHFDNHQFTVR